MRFERGGSHIRGGEVARDRQRPVRVDPENMLSSMEDVLSSGRVSEMSLRNYLYNKCETIRIGQTDVIIARENSNSSLPPALESLAEASHTNAILVEYFKPELLANAKKFPVIGELLQKLLEKHTSIDSKTEVSEQLAAIARETDKPIAVADIANGPNYEGGYAGLPALASIGLAYPSIVPLCAAYYGMWGFNRFQEFFSKKGHFDPEKIHEYEKILYDTEDARRVIVAQGMGQLASEYPPRAGHPSRILACYPDAHAIRIGNYLTNTDLSSRATRAIKEGLYGWIPGADISVRQYKWTDQLERLATSGFRWRASDIPVDASLPQEKNGGQHLAGWTKFSDRPIW